MAFFSKPSAADPLLADAEAGNHRAPDAPSKKRPALKTVLGGVGLFFALAFGAAAAFDASKSPSVPEQTEFTSKKWHKIQDVARSYKHTIRLKADDRFVLTLDSNDPKNGATIILAKAALKGTRDKSQEWVYNLATKQIQLKANDKFVVNLVDLGNGATINLWEKIDGKENQRWIFKDGKFHAAADEKYVLNLDMKDVTYKGEGQRSKSRLTSGDGVKISLWSDVDDEDCEQDACVASQEWIVQDIAGFKEAYEYMVRCEKTGKSAADCYADYYPK